MADPYTVLGVDPSSSPTTLRKAYKAAIRSAHPDRGGSQEEMIKLQRSYEIITNTSTAVECDTALTSWFARMRKQAPDRQFIDTMYDESVSGLTDIAVTEHHWRADPIPPNHQNAGQSHAGVSVEFDAASVRW